MSTAGSPHHLTLPSSASLPSAIPAASSSQPSSPLPTPSPSPPALAPPPLLWSQQAGGGDSHAASSYSLSPHHHPYGHSSSSPSPSAPSCLVGIGRWLRRQWWKARRTFSLRNNVTVRICCVLLMFKCAFVALTGRGVVSIIQAIVGVIFSIEGFWGAVKFDAATVRRFLAFVVVYFVVSVTVSIVNLRTIDTYCSTAFDEEDRMTCEDTALTYSYVLLGASLGLVPLIFGVSVVFYLSIQASEHLYGLAGGGGAAGNAGPYRYGRSRRRKHDGEEDEETYEVTEIVERMGFSSD